MPGFAVEHPRLRAAGAFAFLAPDFFGGGALGGNEPVLLRLNLVEKHLTGVVAVESLLARFLAFHLHPGRPVEQHHAGGDFVDVLAAMAARADKAFFDVRLAYLERGHALRQLMLFLGADRKHAHASQAKPKPRRLPRADRKFSFGGTRDDLA